MAEIIATDVTAKKTIVVRENEKADVEAKKCKSIATEADA